MKCPGEGKRDTARCESFSEIGSGGPWLVRKSGVMDVAGHSLPWSSSAPPVDAYGPLLGQRHPQLPPFSDPHNQESAPSPNPFLHRPHLVNLQVLGTPLPKCLSNLMPPLHSLNYLLPTCTFSPTPLHGSWTICLWPFFLPVPSHTPGQSDVSESLSGSSLSCLNWTTPVGFHLFLEFWGILRYTLGGSQFSKSIFYLTLCFHLNDPLFKDYYYSTETYSGSSEWGCYHQVLPHNSTLCILAFMM